jgi:hypothetical protein
MALYANHDLPDTQDIPEQDNCPEAMLDADPEYLGWSERIVAAFPEITDDPFTTEQPKAA